MHSDDDDDVEDDELEYGEVKVSVQVRNGNQYYKYWATDDAFGQKMYPKTVAGAGQNEMPQFQKALAV